MPQRHHRVWNRSARSLRESCPIATRTISQLVVKDWNGDGFPDLVVIDSWLQLLYNRGDGTFDHAVDCGLAVGAGVVVSDFNHDGHMDIAMERFGMETPDGVDVLFGWGGCRFSFRRAPGRRPEP